MTHEYMTVREVADLMRVKKETIYRFLKKYEDFPKPVRHRRPYIWDAASLREWVANKD